MALPALISPTSPNPTIGNPFDTAASTLDTLLTAIKADINGLDNYLKVTGLENIYIAPQAVQSPQVYLQGQEATIFQTGSTSLPVGTDTFVSTEFSITAPFNNALVEFNYNYMFNYTGSGNSEAFYSLKRSTTSGFGAGGGSLVLPSGISAPRARQVGATFKRLPYSHTVHDTITTSGTTVYYRFYAREGVTAVSQVDCERSFYNYKIFNGFY